MGRATGDAHGPFPTQDRGGHPRRPKNSGGLRGRSKRSRVISIVASTKFWWSKMGLAKPPARLLLPRPPTSLPLQRESKEVTGLRETEYGAGGRRQPLPERRCHEHPLGGGAGFLAALLHGNSARR